MAGRPPKPTRHWLIQARHDKGITHSQLAKELEVTPQAVFYWESGQRTPNPKLAQKLARILGFKWTKFYEETDIQNQESEKEGG